jgi:hypothetical protein
MMEIVRIFENIKLKKQINNKKENEDSLRDRRLQ